MTPAHHPLLIVGATVLVACGSVNSTSPSPSALRAYAEANNITLHGFPGGTPGYGHWNQTGHAQAGALIAETICAGLP